MSHNFAAELFHWFGDVEIEEVSFPELLLGAIKDTEALPGKMWATLSIFSNVTQQIPKDRDPLL